MSLPAFAHVALNCRDMAATERFYVDRFGFRRARVVPLGDTSIVFLRSGDVYLELFQGEGEAAVGHDADGPKEAGVRHLAFSVDSVDAWLVGPGQGVDVTLGPLGFDDFIPGWRTVWVRDPDGTIVEVAQGFRDQVDPPPLTTTRQSATERQRVP